LLDAGAIILVKGNIPQLVYSCHSDNRVWGCAKNPYDQSRSCGGSSGGDAGLVASRCIPMALGTDIGGSIRIPCHFTGIRGFKPTSERTSALGSINILPNNFIPRVVIKGAIGPMGRSVDDLVQTFKLQVPANLNQYDPYVPPCPFREDLYSKAQSGKVKVGYLESYEINPTTDAVKRSIKIAKEALE
jgi:fatty acid amide hydrolase